MHTGSEGSDRRPAPSKATTLKQDLAVGARPWTTSWRSEVVPSTTASRQTAKRAASVPPDPGSQVTFARVSPRAFTVSATGVAGRAGEGGTTVGDGSPGATAAAAPAAAPASSTLEQHLEHAEAGPAAAPAVAARPRGPRPPALRPRPPASRAAARPAPVKVTSRAPSPGPGPAGRWARAERQGRRRLRCRRAGLGLLGLRCWLGRRGGRLPGSLAAAQVRTEEHGDEDDEGGAMQVHVSGATRQRVCEGPARTVDPDTTTAPPAPPRRAPRSPDARVTVPMLHSGR